MAITALSTASAIAAESISLNRTVIMAQAMAAITKMIPAGLTGTNFASKSRQTSVTFLSSLSAENAQIGG